LKIKKFKALSRIGFSGIKWDEKFKMGWILSTEIL
jgi:hypothetical protein